jgi:hypothetical protein
MPIGTIENPQWRCAMRSGSVTAILAFTAAAVSLTAGRAHAQTGFEGVVTFQSTQDDGKVETVTQTTKGQSFRLDGMGPQGGAFIYDAGGKRVIMVEPSEKKAIVMTEEEQKQMRQMMEANMSAMRQRTGKSAPAADEDDAKIAITRTGKSEVVAGTKCEVIHASWTDSQDKKREGDACVADGVGFAIFSSTMLDNPMLTASGKAKRASWMQRYREAVGPNKGILKAVSYKDGKPKVELEATKIERKSVDASTFAPPAGYTVVNLGDMMRQMQGMQQGKQPSH